jgi:hypothetical protein
MRAVDLSNKGQAISPLFISIFAGLILFVVTFSAIDLLNYPKVIGYWIFAIDLAVVGLAGLIIFLRFQALREWRFKHGTRDTMLICSMMRERLQIDCGKIEERLASTVHNRLEVTRQMVEDQFQALLFLQSNAGENRKGLCEKKISASFPFANLFNSEKEYEARSLPHEIELISEVITRHWRQLLPILEALKIARKRLFTSMGDYLEVMVPLAGGDAGKTEGDIAKAAKSDEQKKIQMTQQVVTYINTSEKKPIDPDFVKTRALRKMAEERILRVLEMIAEYRRAWQRLLDEYDAVCRD